MMPSLRSHSTQTVVDTLAKSVEGLSSPLSCSFGQHTATQNQMKAGCIIKSTIKTCFFLKALEHKVENLGLFIVENMYIRCSNKQIVKLSICGSFNCSAWAFSTDLISQIKVLCLCQYSTINKSRQV